METYIAAADQAYIEQKKNFCLKIGTYSGTLGLDPVKVSAVAADLLLEDYIFSASESYSTFSKDVNSYKRLLRRGIDNQVLGAVPLPPALPAAPAVTAAKAQARWATLIQDCARSGNFNESIGNDLGILKPQTPFNPQAGKPEFHIEFSSGGHPLLVWIKGLFQGVEIWVNRGAGWVKLDTDFSPDYIDKFTLPAVNASAIWKYKMIYLFEDEIVGSWSEEIPVTVTGTV